VPKVFTIYPTDKQQSTKFLNRINNYLKYHLNGESECYKIGFNDIDHSNCLKKAVNSNTKFIIFMGHGRSDKLYGSCAKDSNGFVSFESIENNDSLYNNENFINSDSIVFFKGKVFFSFSCNSNKNQTNSLGRIAIQNGVLSFIGFGDIPTDFEEPEISEKGEQREVFPKRAIAVFKGIIIKIIKQSVLTSIQNNYSVQGLVDLIKLKTNIEIQNLILSRDRHRHKDAIINKLYSFKSEIVIMGNKFEKLL